MSIGREEDGFSLWFFGLQGGRDRDSLFMRQMQTGN